MATQVYMPRETKKKNVDVTRLAQTQAPGHPPELQPRDGAENRTPSPTRAPTSTADIARSTSWGRSMGDPGDNASKQGFGGASSLNPSEKAGPATIDPHGPAGADPVLRNLAMGTRRAIDANDDWQTREISREPYPTTRGISARGSGGSPSGTVPAKTGAPADDSAARRNAGLRQAGAATKG